MTQLDENRASTFVCVKSNLVDQKGEGYPKTCTCSCGCQSAAEGDSGKCKYCKEEKCKKKTKSRKLSDMLTNVF
ncbi:putative Metallothionein [Seiridium unicorne]|uniref:Metallothionein n=1 Tax=Seiridium unicorne TaxID=138068 RepID=A0ABR2UUI5_9PEZI